MALTQEQRVLNYLKDNKGITRYIAMEQLYILNLPEVIRKLRSRGHDIVSNTRTNKSGEHWTEYTLNRGD